MVENHINDDFISCIIRSIYCFIKNDDKYREKLNTYLYKMDKGRELHQWLFYQIYRFIYYFIKNKYREEV